MPVPILKQHDVLIVSFIAPLDDDDLGRLREDLLEQVGRHRAKSVVIDVSGLDVLDSFAARTLLVIAQCTRLRGAQTVLVGIQPDIAMAMIQLGLTLEGVTTALDLEDGLELVGGGKIGGARGDRG
jgi:rsbT antagonist protein RsbS